jgi:hypothetical protein
LHYTRGSREMARERNGKKRKEKETDKEIEKYKK